jgi:hypothetical protein
MLAGSAGVSPALDISRTFSLTSTVTNGMAEAVSLRKPPLALLVGSRADPSQQQLLGERD